MAGNPVSKIQNQTVLDALFSDDSGVKKTAQTITTDYIQTKAREDGIMRAILPPETIGLDELDPQVTVEAPTKIFEKEPWNPPAISVPFGSKANVLELVGDRGLVVFHKITTPVHRKDKFLLANYRADVRQIITDNDLKEILTEEDVTTFGFIDLVLGTANATLTWANNVALHVGINGGLTPETWVDMMQTLMRTQARFRCHTVVMNQVLAENLVAWDGDELSQATLEEVNQRGWVSTNFKGKNLIITIKRDVVPDDVVYMFAAPNQLGRFWMLQDVTMYPDARGTILEWWSEETIGITLQPIACAKATLTGV